jgi:hypothetical protein
MTGKGKKTKGKEARAELSNIAWLHASVKDGLLSLAEEEMGAESRLEPSTQTQDLVTRGCRRAGLVQVETDHHHSSQDPIDSRPVAMSPFRCSYQRDQNPGPPAPLLEVTASYCTVRMRLEVCETILPPLVPVAVTTTV